MDSRITPTELYRIALVAELSDRGRGAQTRLAGEVGISRSQLNDIVKGRTGGPEGLRNKIAYALGWTYEEMLTRGRAIFAGEVQPDEDGYSRAADVRDEKIALLLDRAIGFGAELIARSPADVAIPRFSSTVAFFKKFLAKKKIVFVFDEEVMCHALAVVEKFDPKELSGGGDLLSKGECALEVYRILKKEVDEGE